MIVQIKEELIAIDPHIKNIPIEIWGNDHKSLMKEIVKYLADNGYTYSITRIHHKEANKLVSHEMCIGHKFGFMPTTGLEVYSNIKKEEN